MKFVTHREIKGNSSVFLLIEMEIVVAFLHVVS